MSGVIDDWDSIPVKSGVAASSGGSKGAGGSITSDWDAVPVRDASKPQAQSAATKSVTPAMPTTQQLGDATDNIISAAGKSVYNLGSTIVSGWKGLATLATGGSLEDAANAVTEDQKYREAAVPELSQKAKDVEQLINLPATAVGKVADYAGEKTFQATGSPAVATAVNTSINALPLIFMGKGGKAAPAAAAPVAEVSAKSPSALQSATNFDVPTYLRRQQAANAEIAQPVQAPAAAAVPEQAPKPAVMAEAPTTSASRNIVAEAIGAPEAGAAQVPAKLPAVEQTRRAEILQRIGLDKARTSSLAGDEMGGATEAQMSRFNEPAGRAAKEQFDAERAALHNHAERIVSDTGGTVGTDNSALYARGNTIVAPLDSLKQWFDTNTKQLYAEADKRAGGVPIEMPETHRFIGGDQAEFLGTTEGESLLKGVNARMKSLGMVDSEGKPQPVTVQQAEQMKQYLNNQWQPRTARLIRGLKDAIDEDVTKTAGEDIYKKARAMRSMRAATLDDPNGIAKIMDASGPDGINRAVSTEKIADTVTGLPVDQLAHIVKTLKNVPAELQPHAQAALAEIKAQFANKILDAGASRAGQWGARDVTKYMKNNREKMQQVFSPEELAKISDLHEAGNILTVNHSYPGAAAQAANALKSGLMTKAIGNVATLLGGGAGSLVGAPGAGAVAGRLVGEKMTSKMGEGAALKKFNSGVTNLSDFPK